MNIKRLATISLLGSLSFASCATPSEERPPLSSTDGVCSGFGDPDCSEEEEGWGRDEYREGMAERQEAQAEDRAELEAEQAADRAEQRAQEAERQADDLERRLDELEREQFYDDLNDSTRY